MTMITFHQFRYMRYFWDIIINHPHVCS